MFKYLLNPLSDGLIAIQNFETNDILAYIRAEIRRRLMSELFLLIGVLLMFFGLIGVIETSGFYVKGVNIGRFGGLTSIVLGMYLSYIGINRNIKPLLRGGGSIIKCSECGNVEKKNYKVHDQICINCGGNLEQLEGFFDRHP